MSNPTTPFSWQMPTATDLVTDLPADFEVFGQAVATSMADLLGGTSGQILAKNSNTDMDFVWIANDQGDITAVTAGTGITGGGTSGAVTITNDMATTITASGDIVVGTGSGTYDNLPIGTTGQVLTADTTVSPYKVKWATPASSTPTYVGVGVYKSASQTLSNNTITAITFDNEDFDTDAFHSNVTNTSRFTIPAGKGGKYLVGGIVGYAHNATGARAVYLYKNGVAYNYVSQLGTVAQSPYGTHIPFNFVISLVATDYIEIFGWQTSGGNLTVSPGQDNTNIQVSYLGA